MNRNRSEESALFLYGLLCTAQIFQVFQIFFPEGYPFPDFLSVLIWTLLPQVSQSATP